MLPKCIRQKSVTELCRLQNTLPSGSTVSIDVRSPLARLIAETFSCKNKTEEAIKIYDYVQRQYMKLFVTNNTVLNSYLLQMKSECHIRQYNDRNKDPADEAEELAMDAVEMMEMILGKKQGSPEVNNFLLSLRIQQLGDVYRDIEKHELAE